MLVCYVLLFLISKGGVDNMLRKLYSRSTGFTLIELLIVIVIIGILAGVVIGVLNPVQQQNRARDAATRSSLSKMALSTKSLFASSPRSVNRSPTHAEFSGGVGNIGTSGAACTNNDPLDGTTTCTFTIEGISLPATCSNSFWV